MYSYAHQIQQDAHRQNNNSFISNTGNSVVNQRKEAVVQQKLQTMADSSPYAEKTTQLQSMADQYVAQRQENRTGLPDGLKSGIEHLSGYSMDDVKVHYNSSQPAQLNAHAYAQGTQIHIASGQEKHLPHEAWHVVQQKQGRVKATSQLKRKISVNDDAGLEAEADKMGMLALQTVATDQPVLQSSEGSVDGVAQLARYRIGTHGMINRHSIVQEYKNHGQTNTLHFPRMNEDINFSDEYGGAVLLAMQWASQAIEGSSGWADRDYYPEEFHVLANKAFSAIRNLALNPALNNDDNKTLIAIRTFRSARNTEMAQSTLDDLTTVFDYAQDSRGDLAAAGLINNADDAVVEVRTDPAEAHPNTLPTSRITYQGGRTVYFKGRTGRVENSLVGTGQSSARVISEIDNVPNSGTGMHTFVSQNNVHFSQDVGAPMPNNNPTWDRVVNAWVSGARTALMVMLTGTGDLHSSNIIEGMDGLKHIIDAEFLMELTNWQTYMDVLEEGELPQFEVKSGVPGWALNFTKGLDDMQRQQLANEVAERFATLNLDQEGVQELVLAPIRNLMDGGGRVLLRISPDTLNTTFWLQGITNYHNHRTMELQQTFINDRWRIIRLVFLAYQIQPNNADEAKEELTANFNHGRVPLLHIDAATGEVYLNKMIVIGQLAEERSVGNFLQLTKQVVTNRYNDIVLNIRDTIRDTHN